ncbi:receptor-like protein 46 [Manihot esculenta]|uniref:Uncharacterized protein n=1 Tax=Manihot esculenta TaxID=3983 RepID=A0ACB7HZQ5_MANES|nr:receptor-like protein 46 [Manihot esculenta]KAG8657720.1 hypothetical protein MANES_03G086903v8 [Manihot esculenta]
MAKLILIFLFFIFLITPTSLSCPDDQKQALLQFKSLVFNIINSSSSDYYYSPLGLDSWNSSSDCCYWEMVTCNSRSSSRSVTALDLHSLFPLGPQGPMPVPSSVLSPLSRIKSLMFLDISSNYIVGEIPVDMLANLSRLVHLDLMFNNFSGFIPSQIFHFKYLQYLDISSNFLTGMLSEEVGALKNLRVLKLDYNSLAGNIPGEIGNLTKLQRLSLRGNSFVGRIPSSVLYLKELQELDLRDNALSMEIPANIGELTNLTTLALSNNRLTGGIPSSIQKLNKLQILRLQDNLLAGGIPTWLFDIKSLKELFVGGNNLTWDNNVDLMPKCMLS